MQGELGLSIVKIDKLNCSCHSKWFTIDFMKKIIKFLRTLLKSSMNTQDLINSQSTDLPILLVRYRDSEMDSYRYFWTIDGITQGPSFDSAVDAEQWLNSILEKHNLETSTSE